MEASMFPIASVGIGCLLSYFQPYSALPTFSLSKYILTFLKQVSQQFKDWSTLVHRNTHAWELRTLLHSIYS